MLQNPLPLLRQLLHLFITSKALMVHPLAEVEAGSGVQKKVGNRETPESRNKTTHLGPKTYERCIVPPLDLYRQTNCMLKLFRTQHAGDLPETPLPWLYFRSHASGGNVSRDSL
ncbi:hypothetical protein J6590_100368 [Homalodisca vitripennis]|nr:hypothetical protein J6590_100368 [Homalodisca vitripennis]